MRSCRAGAIALTVHNLIYNRVGQKLGGKKTSNPINLWIRSEGCVEPIIDQDAFLRVKAIMQERRVDISEEEMLARLRRVLMKKGKLTVSIIDKTVGLPCYITYLKHFGSLRNVYRLIGYTETQFWDRLEVHKRWGNLNAGNAALLRERCRISGCVGTVYGRCNNQRYTCGSEYSIEDTHDWLL